MKILINLIVTLFFIGKFPYAPGTIASLFSFFILFFIFQLTSLIFFIFLFFLILIISIIFIKKYIIEKKIKDSKEIVIDEFLGCMIIFIFIPIINYNNQISFLLISFITFRFFDILKIYPINLVNNQMNNEYGIILDDILAGIYSIIILYILYEYILF